MSKVIAEIGCNHKGSVDIAKEMISVASLHCNVDVVKFQKRTIRDLLTEKEYSMPHPVPHNSYGKTYGSHRDFLELSLDEQWFCMLRRQALLELVPFFFQMAHRRKHEIGGRPDGHLASSSSQRALGSLHGWRPILVPKILILLWFPVMF